VHKSSFECMKNFVNKHLDKSKQLSILDIGACDVNGSYKSLFECNNWEYAGMDIVAGKNVDIVGWENIVKKYDVIISGQTIEHVNHPWDWLKLAANKLNKNGLLCVIAPNTFVEHRYPIDTYRYYPDGIRDLFNYANIIEIEIYKSGIDTVGIGKRQ